MEKNTVILNVEDYNELRDFKKKIEEGYTYKIVRHYWNDIEYLSTEDAVKEIHDEYLSVYKQNEELKKENQELKKDILNDNDINNILNMNWWGFKKLKKKLKKELKK
mgnify:CR=1 FL=1